MAFGDVCRKKKKAVPVDGLMSGTGQSAR